MVKIDPNKIILAYAFLLPALLLTTPNWSVGITLLFLVYAIIYFRSWLYPELKSLESLLIFSFIFNFLAGFPSFIHGGFDPRVIDMGSRYLIMIPLFLFLLGAQTKSTYRIMVLGVVVGALGAFAISNYQYFYLDYSRVKGFKNIIYFAFLSVSLLFFLLTSISEFASKRIYLFFIISTALLTVFTVLSTATKGALIAFPPLILLLGFLYRDKINIKSVVISTSAILVISITAYLTMDTFKARVINSIQDAQIGLSSGEYGTVGNTGIKQRIELLKLAYYVLEDSPLTGMSNQQRSDFYTELVNKNLVEELRSVGGRKTNWGHAHNEIMEAAASKGIWGIAGVLMLYIIPIIFFMKHTRSDNKRIYSVSRTGVIFVAGFIIFGFTETPLRWNLTSIYYPAVIMLLWVSIKSSEQSDRNA